MPSLSDLKRDWKFVNGIPSFAATLADRAGNRKQQRGAVRTLQVRGERFPFAIRPGTSDYSCLCEIYRDRAYEPARSLVPPDSQRILDLGSNAGYSVRKWLDWAPNAQIIAVEPDADSMRMVQANAALAQREAQIIAVQTCVAASERGVMLDRGRRDWANRMAPVSGEQTPEFVTTTVPALLESAGWTGQRIDLLKCDIEGAEREVFADCASWIHLVDLLIVETHMPYTMRMLMDDLHRNGVSGKMTMLDVREDEFEVALITLAPR